MESGGKISGVENYTTSLIEHAPKSSGQHHTLFGFYNAYREVEMPVPGTEQFKIIRTRIPNKIFNFLLATIGYPKFENLYGQFDVVWLPDLRPFAVKKNTRLAITVHDASPIMHPEFYSLRRTLWHRIINYRMSYKRADIIFAVSEYTKYDLVKLFGIDEQKIKVVYPGIDHARFHTNLNTDIQHRIRKKYNLPHSYILTISTLEPRKNIPGVIAAFDRIQTPDVHLVIAGRPGWLYKDIYKKINSSPKRSCIHLIGYVPEADKPYLISMASLVCYPSFYEGFGFVPLEAMACGVPAITSARTSMPEICGDAALLVEPYQLADLTMAIESLLTDPVLRDDLIRKGLQRARMFDWSKTATIVYDHLLTAK